MYNYIPNNEHAGLTLCIQNSYIYITTPHHI